MVIYLLAYSYAIISTLLLILGIKLSSPRKGGWKLACVWLGIGVIFNIYSFSWYYTVYPLLWLPPGLLQLFGIFVAHIILSLVAGIPYIICAIVFLRHSTSSPNSLKPIIFGASLAFAEIFRSFFISTLFKGEGTDVSFHYISGAFGNILSMTPFVEFAYFGGTYMLSLIVGVIAYILIDWRNYKMYLPHVGGILLLYLVLHFFVPTYGPSTETKVGVVTTSFEDVSDDKLATAFKERIPLLLTLTHSFKEDLSIILYPEDTRLVSNISQKEMSKLRERYPDTLLVDGDTITINQKLTNVSVFSSPDTDKISLRSKSFLLPFNEYMPYFFSYLLPFFLPEDGMGDYKDKHTYIPIESGKVYQFRNLRIATLLCSEAISYKVLEQIKKENPSLILAQSRLQVFHDNPVFWMHLFMFSKNAAAQTRRPFISSADGAPSLVVSPHGKIIKVIPTGVSTTTISYPF